MFGSGILKGLLFGASGLGLTALLSLSAGAATKVKSETRPNDVVHEWGTFTSVSGSDGVLLNGLEREEEQIPAFVYRGFDSAEQKGKSAGEEVYNVTIKMETPVLYFYSDKEYDVTVDVGFKNGSISQWYPQRSGGEKFDNYVDFAKSREGSIQWKAKVLAPNADDKLSPNPKEENRTWVQPRATDANLVKSHNGEVEKFLFYRGVGNFGLPLKTRIIQCKGNTLRLENTGAEKIPHAFVYYKDAKDGAAILWSGALNGKNGTAQLDYNSPKIESLDTVRDRIFREFGEALVSAGLYEKEADAMIRTWWHSYFEKEGLRVFWIVPREFTDEILPISISPAPKTLERVLVGRSEVLTPEFEQMMLGEQAKDANAFLKKYYNDRYYLAYQARMKSLKK